MPKQHACLAEVVVGAGGAASIDFTSIPSTYTDLVLKVSTRSNTANASNGYYYQMTINSATTNQSTRYINSNGTVVQSSSFARLFGYCAPSDSTSNTFASDDFYFPNYAGSSNKPVSADLIWENNATASNMSLLAGLWSQTAAISSISIAPAAGSFVQYSVASLYGITNS